MMDLRGELAALGAAFLWALATVMFGQLGKQLAPLVLNLVKGLLAISLIGLTLAVQALYQPQDPWQIRSGLEQGSVLLLLGSGVIGIGLGDTAYFTALNYLGARRVLLLESLAPAMAALMALGFLGEYLALRDWLGIVLTLLGVSWVVSERAPGIPGESFQPWRGICYGCLAAVGQAVGAVMSRAALADTAVDPLWSTLLRLGGGLSIMGILLPEGRAVALSTAPPSLGSAAGGVDGGGVYRHLSGPVVAADGPEVCCHGNCSSAAGHESTIYFADRGLTGRARQSPSYLGGASGPGGCLAPGGL
ncbi:hypothetical protein XM38_020070 [Halomicronema hongdechloris C2206]|uniref:EamA domain-containing protein n=1 Tax=Halomicronema hongdechloris C2206 TaxID=1641165 RepID=A0A1Z3HLS5_9CYAN|nr:DMT family transporter [Halomicronema hongdechloris]ASC71057.1 hypothetical protein XM38_020070 [Halomicronema hongdechloris C2206]